MRLLAPWQEGRAKELLAANLEGGILLKDLSVEFDLSAGQFTRVFRRSTGVTPHRWLQTRRIESAKRMLLQPTARDRAFTAPVQSGTIETPNEIARLLSSCP